VVDGRIEKGKVTRERLIAAARRQFGERGYEATSIEAVLDAAGVARGALYHHFPTKEALFEAVLDQVVEEIAVRAAVAARAAGDPLASLHAGCNVWLETVLDPAIQRIALLDPPSVVGWTRWRELDEKYILGGVRVALARLAEAGAIPPEQIDLLSHMILASVNEAALLIARAEDPRQALELGKAAVDRLLDRIVHA
jgi:AcrR family transcriptional regulator